MDVEFQDESGLSLSFPDQATLEEFVERLRSEGGFLVSLDTQLKLFAKTALRLASGGEIRVEGSAEVAQVFPAPAPAAGEFRTAFLVDPSALTVRPSQSPAGPPVESPPVEAPSGEAAEESDDDAESQARRESGGEMDGASPAFKIREMNPNQKARLAMRAGRTERQLLLRENSPQILQGLLVNPRVESKDVLQIVKSTHANGAILQRVAGDPRWGKNQEILAAVAKNPKTPTPYATRLIEKLRTSDLRLMAKMSGGLKEILRKAALREYLRRTSR